MVHLERWRPSRTRLVLERMALPLAYLMNRPALAGASRLLLEFALRCNGIGNNLEADSGLTHSEERFLRRIAPDLARGLVLDVGANVGGYSRFLRGLAPEATIIAFEPHPRTFARLAPVAAEQRVRALNLAMSEVAGHTTLYDFADHDGSTQASLDPAVIGLHGGGPVVGHAVEVITLDDFAAREGLDRIDLLKIDTEGFDLPVLKGAAGLLREKRIARIHFEFIASNIVRRISMKDFFEVLEGYRIHRLCLNGALLPLGRYSPKHHEVFVRQNLVALPA